MSLKLVVDNTPGGSIPPPSNITTLIPNLSNGHPDFDVAVGGKTLGRIVREDPYVTLKSRYPRDSWVVYVSGLPYSPMTRDEAIKFILRTHGLRTREL